jgi:hypothetical protein
MDRMILPRMAHRAIATALALALGGCAPLREPALNAAGDQMKRGATAGRYFAASTFHTVDFPYVHVSVGPPPSAEFSLWHIVNNPPPPFLSGAGMPALPSVLSGPPIK